MKKYLFLMIALVGLVGMSGCKKTEVVETIMPNRTIKFDIPANGWRSENDGLSWFFTVDLPELDDAYFENGYVNVHLSFVDDEYEALPTTFDQIAYSFNYGFDQEGGYLRVFCQASDSPRRQITPPSELVYGKLILSDSDPLN